MMYNDARIKDALNSLQKIVDERREADYNNDADLFLLKVFDGIFCSYSVFLLKVKFLFIHTLQIKGIFVTLVVHLRWILKAPT